MRTLMLMIFTLAIAGFTNAQKPKEGDVPEAVKTAFQKQFPAAQSVKWGKEDNDLEAEFKLNSEETSAVFDASGALKETEVELDAAKLPAAITDYCTKNYPGYKISEAAKATDAKGVTVYETLLSKGKDKFEAIFDDKGGFMKKVVETEGENKDKD